MTYHGSTYPFPLGGHANGRYWQALAQASGDTSLQSYLSNLGAAQASYNPQPEPEPDPIEDAGIRAGEIVGYRAWNVVDGLLHSMAASFIWFPGVAEEADEIGMGFGTGFHAFKTLREAYRQYPWADAWGEVSLWGEVIEHEKGYRAEFASVRRIIRVSRDIPFIRLRARILNSRYCRTSAS